VDSTTIYHALFFLTNQKLAWQDFRTNQKPAWRSLKSRTRKYRPLVPRVNKLLIYHKGYNMAIILIDCLANAYFQFFVIKILMLKRRPNYISTMFAEFMDYWILLYLIMACSLYWLFGMSSPKF
jgi:hypothetical protein